MNLHEYQSKQLFAQYAIPVPKGEAANTPDAAVAAAERLGGSFWVVKAQVHAGGRAPLILPFRECPGASIKATRMIGQKIGGFRSSVVEKLPSTLGCTQLNDVLRALSDVPGLAELLPPGHG